MAAAVSPASILTPRDERVPAPDFVHHQFTVKQYHDMIEHGIFAEDEPVELIRGVIVRKMPIGNSHAATVKRLNRLFAHRLSAELLVSVQDPIATLDSEPEPDIAILNFRDDLYASRRPAARDVRLLIEVADSSLNYDREIKGAVYAQAGIVEYWIVNLNNATIEIYRDPQPEGRFATVTTAQAGEIIAPSTLTAFMVTVNEVLGIAHT